MSEQKQSKYFSRQVATGSLWSYQGREGGKFFAGNIDFGLLGVANIMVFQREKEESDGEKQMPDWNILTSNGKEKDDGILLNIGALWNKSYEKDGKKHKYLSGVLSAGVHGEYQIAIFSIDGEKRSDRSPDKRISVSIQRERGEGADQAGQQMGEDDVPF